MDNLTIRAATFNDIPFLVELLRQLFSIEEDFSFNPVKHERGLDLLIDAKDRAIVLVAVWDDKIVGMLTAQVNISTVEGTIAATLEDMVVDEHYRGKGIGKSLMDAAYKWAKDRRITRLQLLADKTNAPALAYYDRLGWKPTKMFCLRKYVSS